MKINRGTVWHTYTTQSPEFQNANKFASDLIDTGLFLAILTPNNTFKCLTNNGVTSIKLDMRYENNAVTVEGGNKVHEAGVCALTANAFFNCINIRLSERKLFHTTFNNRSENIICCQKPIIIKNENEDFLIHPIIRLYSNGIAHVTFVDTAHKNRELTDFINNVLGLPFILNESITTSIEFANLSLLLDYSGIPLLKKKNTIRNIKHSLKKLTEDADDLTLGEHAVTGKYVEYTKTLQIHHNLSDIARYLIAITFSVSKKRSIKDLVFGNDLTKYYSSWNGKPSIYIFEHEDQEESSVKNYHNNLKTVHALLGKSNIIPKEKYKKNYLDHRVYDDFNFFSEQAAALTLLSSGVKKEIFAGTFTEENLMWDNQIKSELREFISFFYESRINKIENEKTHLGLAKIQEDVIAFEEWLRISSKKYGEIQDFTCNTKNSSDIKEARHNITESLKAKMLVIKLIDSDTSEKRTKKITIAFGLIASTSLSPVIIKPLFKTIGITTLINKNNLSNYEDAFYFITALILVWLVIIAMNIKTK
ncbi:hypothetical protein [Lelliottia amnigena]